MLRYKVADAAILLLYVLTEFPNGGHKLLVSQWIFDEMTKLTVRRKGTLNLIVASPDYDPTRMYPLRSTIYSNRWFRSLIMSANLCGRFCILTLPMRDRLGSSSLAQISWTNSQLAQAWWWPVS